ncbi:MAG: acyloxyacyl hydrolase [Alistipes sp.]|nr:acyloxyacyl hydrolase [Alistipes sp.]
MERKAIATLRRGIALLIVTLLWVGASWASTPGWRDSLSHALQFELRTAYSLPPHLVMRNRELANSLHARYMVSFDPATRLGGGYKATYQGIGIAAYTLYSPTVIGTPCALYIFQGARLSDLTSRLGIGYEWNLGLSWGWHPTQAISTRCNVYINVALPITYHLTPHCHLSLTPDYTHFSNGDTRFPNSGANLFGLRLGATYLFNDTRTDISIRRFIEPSDELMHKPIRQRISYDIVAYGGWRADRFTEEGHFYLINERLPLGGIHLQPHYHLNNYFSLGCSLDWQLDSSLNLHQASRNNDNSITYSRPPLWQQMELGLSLRGEIRAPIFTLGIGCGINALKTGYDSSLLYTTFSLKAFVTERLFLYFGYRFNSVQYTQNLMCGMGVRL